MEWPGLIVCSGISSCKKSTSRMSKGKQIGNSSHFAPDILITRRSLKRELVRAQEEIKRIQSVPLVIGQFMEAIDQKYVYRQLHSIYKLIMCLLKYWYRPIEHRLQLCRQNPLHPRPRKAQGFFIGRPPPTLQCPCRHSPSRGRFLYCHAGRRREA